MLYILAVFLPPLAVLLTGRVGQAFINLLLTLLGFIPGIIHAFIIINNESHVMRQNSYNRY